MAVRLILSVVVGLALSLSPAAYAMKQLELKSHSHIAAIDIPLSGKEKAWLAGAADADRRHLASRDDAHRL
jgi:two-component system sensor histidine kinase EvgS